MKNALTVASLLLLAACATQPQYKQMPSNAAPLIKDADAVLSVGQNEITAEINQSQITAATGGGLLFALIDAGINQSRANAAEQALGPVRDALLDFKVNDVLRTSLQGELKSVPWAKDTVVELANGVTTADLDKRVSGSSKNVVLLTGVNYKLSPDFSTVTVTGVANLYPKTPELKNIQMALYKDTTDIDKPNTSSTSPLSSLYRNTFVYTRRLANPTAAIEANGKAWAANGGQPIRTALQEGAEAIAKLVAMDVQKLATGAPTGKAAPETLTIKVGERNLTVARSAGGALSVNAQ